MFLTKPPANLKHVRGYHVTPRNETNRKWQYNEIEIEMVATPAPKWEWKNSHIYMQRNRATNYS